MSEPQQPPNNALDGSKRPGSGNQETVLNDNDSDSKSSIAIDEKAQQLPEVSPKLESQPATPPYSGFSPGRRRFILAITTIAGFFGPLAGGIYLPALPVLRRDFGVSTTAINASVTVFMAIFAVAPLVWSTFSDWKGRRPLYIISIAVYIVANILLASVPSNFGALVVLRIVQAFGSAAVVSMGAGTVADVTEPKNRGAAMAIFLMGPQCGPIFGPVLGGLFAGQTSWRWIFGFLAISGFCLWLIIVFALPETLRSRVGNGSLYANRSLIIFPPRLSSDLAPQSERGPPPPKPSLIALWRLFVYPPIGIVCFNTAMLFSSYFAIAVHLPFALENEYGWSTTATGGGFLAVGIALIVGSFCGGRFSDWRRARAVKASSTGEVDPENRLSDQIWGVLICAAGCIMFGWFLHFKLHPASVLIATFLTGFGMTWVFIATTAFLTEVAKQQAASAFALGNLLRNPGAAIAAVVIEPLITRMGVGWAFTGLGIVDLVFVGTAVILLRFKSPGWRKERNQKMAAMMAAKRAAGGGPGQAATQ